MAAKTVEEVDAILNSEKFNRLSEKQQHFITKVPNAQQFPAYREHEGGTLLGRSTNQMVESMNNANKSIRNVAADPLVALVLAMQMERNRRKKAFTSTDGVSSRAERGNTAPLTPYVAKRIAAIQKRLPYLQVRRTEGRDEVIDGTKSFSPKLKIEGGMYVGYESCSCHEPRKSHFFCCHILKLAMEKGMTVDSLVPDCYSFETWRNQVSEPGDRYAPLLTNETYREFEQDLDLLFPVLQPPGIGRKKKGRQKGALEKRMLGRYCVWCSKDGHNFSTCAKVKKIFEETLNDLHLRNEANPHGFTNMPFAGI